MDDKRRFSLGGVEHEFTPAEEITLDQHSEIVVVLNDAGLTEVEKLVADTLADHADTDAEDFAERLALAIVTRIYRSRQHGRLLAAFVRPPGEDWTRSFAEAAAERFLKLKGVAEIGQFQELLAQLVLAFFANGLGSQTTSRKSSVRVLPLDAEPSPSATATAPISAPSTP